jgi:hypothetical protein
MTESDRMYEEMLQDCKRMIDSTSLVTARMIESIVKNSQLASSATPEMQDMFQSWLKLVSGEVLRDLDGEVTDVNIEETSERIGVTPSTLISLLLYLHRNGSVNIRTVRLQKGNGENKDICHDLK